MKKIIQLYSFLILFLLIKTNSYSQVLKNSATISVKSNTYLNIGGSFVNESAASCHGTINNEGTFRISGNWTNNSSSGSNVVFTGLNSTGCIDFNGTSAQTIGGTRTTTFENITINNSTGVSLTTDINIEHVLLMSSGDFDLRNSDVNLGTTGSVSSESSAKRIKATDGSTDGRGTGTIFTSKTLGIGSYTNVAGLGININTATNFGSTIIKRGHLRQQGTGSYTSNYSIYRYYEIITNNKTINSGTVTFNYFPLELNGHVNGQLIMYQLHFESPVFWNPLTTNNTSPQIIATTVPNSLAKIKLTAASISTPLPINLIDFKANCKNHETELSWSTASELNNLLFTVQKSHNAIQWDSIAMLPGAGNSNLLLHYQYLDKNPEGFVYYRLKQTDYNGVSSYSDPIAVNCESTNNNQIFVYPNPFDNSIIINGLNEIALTFEIVDAIGSIVYKDSRVPSSTELINLQSLTSGFYTLIIIDINGYSRQFKIIKN